MKIKNIIYEEIQSYLTEIGEINLQAYPHTKFIDNPRTYESRFTTEDGDEYSVHFNNVHLDFNKWIGAFKLVNGTYTDVVNKGRLYRVMATVIEIMEDFIARRSPKQIVVDAVKTAGDNDNRRTNLYLKYFQNAFFHNYNIIQTNDFIKLNRKESDSNGDLYEIFNEVKSLLNESYLKETTYKVYHGTNQQFDRFDFNKVTQGIVWFTDSIDSIKNQEHGGMGNKYIMTRYITINNPAGWGEYEKYGLQQLEDMGYDGVILPQGNKTDYFVFSNKSIRNKPNGNSSTNLKEEIYHNYYPKHRGELTFNKVVQRIKGLSSPSTACDLFTTISNRAYKELNRFNSPEEIMDHVYWHGTGGYVSGGLKAGFNIVKKGSEGGGGYGEQYHSISVSKSKNKASNFTNMSSSGIVYPVLLRKDATVEEMPKISDSIELEDILVDLWLRKIDAVKIGDWSDDSEEELVILNPLAILKFSGESYPVYQKKRFTNPDINIYKAIYNTIKNNPEPKGKNSFNQSNVLKVQYSGENTNNNVTLSEDDVADVDGGDVAQTITNDSNNDDAYFSPMAGFGDRLKSIN